MDKTRAENARSFAYCLDPVCLSALISYLVNRWALKPGLGACVGFFHDHLNDVLCIPLFLPPVLLAQRWLGVRQHDRPPTAFELVFHLVVWSICFEAVPPMLPTVFRTTTDPLDVAAYAVGTGLAGLAWGSWRFPRGLRRAPGGAGITI